jgi:hypothetical protein
MIKYYHHDIDFIYYISILEVLGSAVSAGRQHGESVMRWDWLAVELLCSTQPQPQQSAARCF